jgi:hypothetical protein
MIPSQTTKAADYAAKRIRTVGFIPAVLSSLERYPEVTFDQVRAELSRRSALRRKQPRQYTLNLEENK